MKAKYLLFSLALTAGVASCTSEFEQFQTSVNQGQVALKDRAAGEVILTATKAGADETRIVAGDYVEESGKFGWYWEKEDMIGGVMVDGVTAGAGVADASDPDEYNYGYANHPFTTDLEENSKTATFKTVGLVQEGVYVFYNGYDGTNTTRKPVQKILNDQNYIVAGATEADGLSQIASANENRKNGQNLFISPLVRMAIPYGQPNQVPITMKSIYHVLQFNLTAEVGEYINKDFAINKIVLSSLTEGEKVFDKEFTLNPSKLAALQQTVADTLGEDDPLKAYFGDYGEILTGWEGADPDYIQEAMNLVADAMEKAYDISGCADENKVARLVYSFEEPQIYTENGDNKIIMLLVPAGEYTSGLKAKVYTSEGIYTKTIPAAKSELTRGNSKRIKETLTIKGDGTTNINKYNFTNGFNIETEVDYQFALDYIEDHPADFNDTKIPEFIFKNTTDLIPLKNGFPTYKAKYTSEGSKGLILPVDQVLDPAVVQFTAGKAPMLEIAEGKTLTVKSNISELNVTGKGTVAVAQSGEDAITVDFDVMEVGALNITGKSAVNVSATNVTVDDLDVAASATLNATGSVVVKDVLVAAGGSATFGSLTVNTAATFNGATNSVTGVLTNNGTVTINTTVTADEVVNNNNKTVTVEDGGKLTAKVTNSGNVTVKMGGKLTAAKFTNKTGGSKLTLSGEGATTGVSKATITELVNNGTVNIEKPNSSDREAWGGDLHVTDLTNNKADGSNTSFNGFINNNGHLKVEGGYNHNKITLKDWDYAYMELAAALGGDGGVRIESPEHYPAPASAADRKNNIQTTANSVVAAFNNDADYEKEHAHSTDPKYAWSILDIVELSGDIKLRDSSKKYYLMGGTVKLTSNVTAKYVTVKGITTFKAATSGTTGLLKTINLMVEADLTVNNDAKIEFQQTGSAASEVFNIDAKVTNNGTIDVVSNPGAPMTAAHALINANGEFVNSGKIGQKTATLFDAADYDAMVAFINKYFVKNADGTWQGKRSEPGKNDDYRIISNGGGGLGWSETPVSITETQMLNMVKSGTIMKHLDFNALQLKDGVMTYYLYLGGDAGAAEPTDTWTTARSKKDTYDSSDVYLTDLVVAGNSNPVEGTGMNVKNNGGIFNFLHSSNPANAATSWAYGTYTEVAGAGSTKKGDFN